MAAGVTLYQTLNLTAFLNTPSGLPIDQTSVILAANAADISISPMAFQGVFFERLGASEEDPDMPAAVFMVHGTVNDTYVFEVNQLANVMLLSSQAPLDTGEDVHIWDEGRVVEYVSGLRGLMPVVTTEEDIDAAVTLLMSDVGSVGAVIATAGLFSGLGKKLRKITKDVLKGGKPMVAQGLRELKKHVPTTVLPAVQAAVTHASKGEWRQIATDPTIQAAVVEGVLTAASAKTGVPKAQLRQGADIAAGFLGTELPKAE
jgi:hypothetical protein